MSTKIEWTDETWNPVTGCTPVSEGCTNCYAARMAKRLAAMGTKGYDPANPFAVTLHPERLSKPLHWRKPRKVFVVSMGDLFHESVPYEYIAAVFGVMAACPQHTFQVLTKRAERMAAWFGWIDGPEQKPQPRLSCLWHTERAYGVDPGDDARRAAFDGWPLSNVWLGVTAENQETADERIPLLLQCPAAVRFVSVEPMLSAVDLNSVPRGAIPVNGFPPALGAFAEWQDNGPDRPPYKLRDGIDWAICGGESGPSARPMHPGWPRDLRDQCKAAGVAFLFKQWGEWAPEGPLSAKQRFVLADGRTCEPNSDALKSSLYSYRERHGACVVYRVGKHRAGRLLDGALHDEYPEAP